MLPIMTSMTQNLLMNVNQPVMTTPPIIPPPPRTMVTMERDSGLNLAIEEKMQKLLRDIELKQQRLVSEVELRLQTDIRGISQRVRGETLHVVSQQNVRLDQEVSGLSWQIRDLQSDTHSATSGLMQRLETQLSHTTKLEQELSSIKMAPPPAPCPETPAAAPSNELTPELKLALEKWFSDRVKDQQLYVRQTQPVSSCKDCGPLADRMADFALEAQGASVISTRCSETYRTRSACVTLFGFPLWYPSESPRTVIQGNQVLLPGKCWRSMACRVPWSSPCLTPSASLTSPSTTSHDATHPPGASTAHLVTLRFMVCPLTLRREICWGSSLTTRMENPPRPSSCQIKAGLFIILWSSVSLATGVTWSTRACTVSVFTGRSPARDPHTRLPQTRSSPTTSNRSSFFVHLLKKRQKRQTQPKSQFSNS
ncbi:uncharacterized protein LOC134016534 [Osmerus eperlanus]|uniref:uncharacterized protein LOC134016534 n=1 Tax=Osmerus eperlanus TaxID=29151 RepID=UPI002E12F4E9